ncbi:hypothetical protein [Chryseobacterium lactis]|uniref:hypothetical protein n=1 Tax=Chryseobacterium lactis TaxID=1241981 RepID=UPI000F4FF139|nr:hypothetical protein [Chryseobacterium lactis]
MRKWIIPVSLIVFTISLCFNAFKVIEVEEIKAYSSLEILLVGPVSFLGGGIFEFFIWTANIWFLIALIFIYKKQSYSKAFILGLIATVISISFLFWKEILIAENGRQGKIYSLEAGYFLWLTSFLFLTICSFFFNYKI